MFDGFGFCKSGIANKRAQKELRGNLVMEYLAHYSKYAGPVVAISEMFDGIVLELYGFWRERNSDSLLFAYEPISPIFPFEFGKQGKAILKEFSAWLKIPYMPANVYQTITGEFLQAMSDVDLSHFAWPALDKSLSFSRSIAVVTLLQAREWRNFGSGYVDWYLEILDRDGLSRSLGIAALMDDFLSTTKRRYRGYLVC